MQVVKGWNEEVMWICVLSCFFFRYTYDNHFWLINLMKFIAWWKILNNYISDFRLVSQQLKTSMIILSLHSAHFMRQRFWFCFVLRGKFFYWYLILYESGQTERLRLPFKWVFIMKLFTWSSICWKQSVFNICFLHIWTSHNIQLLQTPKV